MTRTQFAEKVGVSVDILGQVVRGEVKYDDLRLKWVSVADRETLKKIVSGVKRVPKQDQNYLYSLVDDLAPQGLSVFLEERRTIIAGLRQAVSADLQRRVG